MAAYHNPYSPTSTSAMVLSQSQMEDNARFIYQYLRSNYGWTLNAVSGLLGNAQAESTLNPARPQNNAVNNGWYPSAPGYTGDAPTPTTTWYGYGLFQITPYLALTGRRENPYNYGNWAISRGLTFSHATGGTGGSMEAQLDWIASSAPSTDYYNASEPSSNQRKWYQHGSSPDYAPTTREYGLLTSTPENCAITFYHNFERSGAGTPGSRPSLARDWYTYLSALPPIAPDRRKSNFIIIAYGGGLI